MRRQNFLGDYRGRRYRGCGGKRRGGTRGNSLCCCICCCTSVASAVARILVTLCPCERYLLHLVLHKCCTYCCTVQFRKESRHLGSLRLPPVRKVIETHMNLSFFVSHEVQVRPPFELLRILEYPVVLDVFCYYQIHCFILLISYSIDARNSCSFASGR